MATAPLTIPTSPTAPLARHPTAVRPHEHARLVLATRDGRETTYVMTKPAIMLGRDSGCDLVLPRREVSRMHARLTASDDDAVMLESLGREPVCVNGQPVTAPVALSDGDVIEIALEGRSKVIRFVQPRAVADETVAIIAKGDVQRRAPMGDANAQRLAAAPPPPPPPPPPPHAAASRPPPPPPPPRRAAAAAPARPAFSPGEVARAAVALAARRAAGGGVAPLATRVACARPPPPLPPARRPLPPHQQQASGGLFIPCASELAARRAGLRKVTRGGDGSAAASECLDGAIIDGSAVVAAAAAEIAATPAVTATPAEVPPPPSARFAGTPDGVATDAPPPLHPPPPRVEGRPHSRRRPGARGHGQSGGAGGGRRRRGCRGCRGDRATSRRPIPAARPRAADVHGC